MNHRRAPLLLAAHLAVAGLSTLGGCKEYFSVDEACNDKVPGDNDLTPAERSAMVRLNCHRRLAGLSAASGNGQVQEQARQALNYVLLNPAGQNLVGHARETTYLKQLSNKPGFTGSTVYDRLTDPVNGVGYTYYDEINSGTREFVDVQWTFGPDPMPSGPDAVDWLMKDPEFRQLAMQGSWIDGAFAEIDLSPEWFVQAGFPDNALPSSGKAYYGVVIYTEPHFEHVDEPVIYPKEEQTDVPLWSYTRVPSADLANQFTQVGFPLTFHLGAIDAKDFYKVEFNQYRGSVDSAALIGPDGRPVDLEIVYPGDESNGTLPDGTWLRTTLAVYPVEPLAPSSEYRFSGVVTTPEASHKYDFTFKTVAEDKDPGYDPLLQAEGTSSGTTSTYTE